MQFFPKLTLKQKGIITFVLLLASLLLNMGKAPLYLEEPRRALIALEMMFRRSYIVPTEFGLFYYKKPPLWNWILIGGFKVFPLHPEIAVRIFSVCSHLLTGLILFLVGKRYHNLNFALITSFFYLVSVDIFFYFSLLGEIDLFYSSITFISFISLFHFYKIKRYYLAFSSFYALNALGVMTKGIPSVAFMVLTLPSLLILNKDFKRLFSFANIMGCFLFLGIIGGYILAYIAQNDINPYIGALFGESSQRAGWSNDLLGVLKDMGHFPLDVLKNIIPATLFLPFLFKKGFIKQINKNKLIQYFSLIFMVNVLMYWFSSGVKQRYVYMLYPLIISCIVYFYTENIDKRPVYLGILHQIFLGINALLIIASLALPFIGAIKSVPGIILVSIFGSISFLYLLYYKIKTRLEIHWAFIWLLILTRLMFNFTVLPFRAINTSAALMKEHAKNIVEITGQDKIKMHTDGNKVVSRTTVFYIEYFTKGIVQAENSLDNEVYYIADTSDIENKNYKIYYSLVDEDKEAFQLIKFED